MRLILSQLLGLRDGLYEKVSKPVLKFDLTDEPTFKTFVFTVLSIVQHLFYPLRAAHTVSLFL